MNKYSNWYALKNHYNKLLMGEEKDSKLLASLSESPQIFKLDTLVEHAINFPVIQKIRLRKLLLQDGKWTSGLSLYSLIQSRAWLICIPFVLDEGYKKLFSRSTVQVTSEKLKSPSKIKESLSVKSLWTNSNVDWRASRSVSKTGGWR